MNDEDIKRNLGFEVPEEVEEEPEPEIEYPIKAKFYVHSNKESNYELGTEIGLPEGDVLNNFCYTGYEIEMDIEVEEDGCAFATHVDGVELKERLRIGIRKEE